MPLPKITHDLGVVARICDKVLVMYAGRTMEYNGQARDVFYQPSQSYSIGLLNAVPRLDAEGDALLTISRQPHRTCCDCQKVVHSSRVARMLWSSAAARRRWNRSRQAACAPALNRWGICHERRN
ncbi:hypothetical protein MJ560_17110 [Klebsiella pneumoniae]|nr:hypothetical protein MJ560_17110 [Klebsiella pneumoniae]